MGMSVMQERIVEEIKLIPEQRLLEIYEWVRRFRRNLQYSPHHLERTMKFAGCWLDMPAETFLEFSQDITERRAQTFARRQSF